MEYKVLTLRQPWASLYAHGIKLIETRPKSTTYRGTYLIHAAQKWSKEQAEICRQEPFISELIKLGFIKSAQFQPYEFFFPLGAIIGAVDIIDCLKIREYYGDPMIIKGNDLIELSFNEISFGNYQEGRYAWIGKNHRTIIEPIPYKNGQGYYQNFKGDESKLIFNKYDYGKSYL